MDMTSANINAYRRPPLVKKTFRYLIFDFSFTAQFRKRSEREEKLGGFFFKSSLSREQKLLLKYLKLIILPTTVFYLCRIRCLQKLPKKFEKRKTTSKSRQQLVNRYFNFISSLIKMEFVKKGKTGKILSSFQRGNYDKYFPRGTL